MCYECDQRIEDAARKIAELRPGTFWFDAKGYIQVAKKGANHGGKTPEDARYSEQLGGR